jgi:hypothetical protein
MQDTNTALAKINANLARLSEELDKVHTLRSFEESAIARTCDPELPLEEWFIALAERCAVHRARKALPACPESALDRAIQTVLGLFHGNFKDLLIGIPYSAPGTNELRVRFRVRWSYYRHLARTADDHLIRVFHGHHSDSADEAA